MSFSLTKSKYITANKIYPVQQDGTMLDLMTEVRGHIEGGLPPDQLHTLSDISTIFH